MEYELYHYGVPGMKWGVRKTRKWALSITQPSSAKSSALAGLYAATGSKRVGKALDKSNQQDAQNWKRAKEDYKRFKSNAKRGRSFIDNHSILHQQFMLFQQQHQQQINTQMHQQAVQTANQFAMQNASLAISGGMNPFMFG